MRKGFSLLEMTLVVGLAALLLGLAFRMANSFLRVARTESLRSELQQSAIISLGRICTDAALTTPSGVSVLESAPVSLALNPYKVGADGSVVDGAGLVSWGDRFCLYTWEPTSRELLRWEWTPTDPVEVADYGSPVRAKRLNAALLNDLVTGRRPPRVTHLATGVNLFQILPVGSQKLLRQPLQFVLEVERQAPGRATPLRFRYSQSIFMAGSE